jgi:hypothetical protein
MRKRESKQNAAGTFNAIRVQPETSAPILRGALYSDDAAQVPIQMRARLSWGTLTFYLLWSKKVSIDQLERLQFVEQYDVQPLFLT